MLEYSGVSVMYERIRACREDRDWTQKAMAQKLHIAQTTYSDYELGKINIPPATLCEMALLFGTSVDYLLGLTDERAPYPRRRER